MIYGRAGAAEKKFSINFSKAKTKNGLSLHPNYDNSYLFVNGAEIYNPIQEEQKAPPPLPHYQLFPCNFDKRRIQHRKFSDFQF